MSLRRMTYGELTLADRFLRIQLIIARYGSTMKNFAWSRGKNSDDPKRGNVLSCAVYSSDYSSQTMPGDRETVEVLLTCLFMK